MGLNHLRILVCGGRKYYDYDKINLELNVIHALRTITTLIQGEASGADLISKQWAKYNRIPTMDFPAVWRNVVNGKYNPNAGSERNQKMLDEGKPDLVVAFPGGKGTANMVKLAEEAGVEVIKIGW
jgi:hypothetical protein